MPKEGCEVEGSAIIDSCAGEETRSEGDGCAEREDTAGDITDLV